MRLCIPLHIHVVPSLINRLARREYVDGGVVVDEELYSLSATENVDLSREILQIRSFTCQAISSLGLSRLYFLIGNSLNALVPECCALRTALQLVPHSRHLE